MAGGDRKRNRSRSIVDDLPMHIKDQVDAMLADNVYTYWDIVDYLKDQGFEVSKSAIGRYALRVGRQVQRLLEAQEQANALIQLVKKNPDADYTEGGLQIMAAELTRKVAQAEEEWDEMPLDKAARVMVSLARTDAYKSKVRSELTSKVKVALEQFRKEVYAELEGAEPELSARLIEVASRVARRLEADES